MSDESEILVPWSFGQVKLIVEDSVWEDFTDRQKFLWLREMDREDNLITKVRLLPRNRMVELFFHRILPSPHGSGATGSATYMAGKWVRIDDFDDVMAEAREYRQQQQRY